MFDVAFPNLGIYIENLPTGITIGNFTIAFYGMIIGLGIIVGLLLTWKEARRTGQNEDDYTDYIIWGIIAGVVGARLYYVAFQWDYYKDHLSEIINLRSGGLAIYGTIIGAVTALIIFCIIKKKNFFQMIDTLIPQLALAQAMGRWGNFFNMEAFGKYTEGLFAMQLRLDKVSVGMLDADVLSHIQVINGVEYIQVTPTFLYESAWCLLIFIVLSIYKYHKKYHGELFCIHAGLYGLERMFIEGLRTDSLMLGNTGIRISQALAGLMVACSIIGYFIIKNAAKTHPELIVAYVNNENDNVVQADSQSDEGISPEEENNNTTEKEETNI